VVANGGRRSADADSLVAYLQRLAAGQVTVSGLPWFDFFNLFGVFGKVCLCIV
jgi:hypothetical protein